MCEQDVNYVSAEKQPFYSPSLPPHYSGAMLLLTPLQYHQTLPSDKLCTNCQSLRKAGPSALSPGQAQLTQEKTRLHTAAGM